MAFTPRVSQILFLLLNSDRELTVKELSDSLNISRRTIYRELEDIDRQLSKYHVTLKTLPGKGMVLEGEEDGKKFLLDEINSSDAFDARNREHRLNRLTLELLKQKEAKKLYYYALLLQVAESTVASDMEQLPIWFQEVNLSVVKKPGLGIYLEGKEQDYREACLRYMDENREKDLLQRIRNHEKSTIYQLFDRYMIEVIYGMLWRETDSIMRKFTETSSLRILCYLALTISRIIEGKEITELKVQEQPQLVREAVQKLGSIIAELEEYFNIHFSEKEIVSLYIHYKGAKLQYIQIDEEFIENEYEVKCLVLEMIQCFEPSIRIRMKNDDEFIQALTAHLKPTLIRLQHNIKIQNPYLDEIRGVYPEIYQKACVAAEVIREKFGLNVPEEEIGMLAVHFGGALVRYEEKVLCRRKVEIGVVCSNGIGISRLLASRLNRIFRNEVNISVLVRDRITENMLDNIDFLVSTFNLNQIDKPSIEVNPMLTEKDIEKIEKYVKHYSGQTKSLKKTEENTQQFLEEVTTALETGNDISHILKSYAVYEMEDKASFEETIWYAGRILGKDEEDVRTIFEAIMAREKLASQIVPEYELALLHGRTAGVRHPKFILVFPKGERFTDSSMKGCKVVMVMLIPQRTGESEALAAVSNAIFGHDEFLEAIINKDKRQMEEYLHFYLREYLKEQLNGML